MEIDQSIDLRVDNVLDRAVLYLATLLFASTVALATIQVLVRYTFVIPTELFYWTEPLARLMFIVMTYIGAAVATRNREHISIDLLLDKLETRSFRVRKALDVVNSCIVLSFLAIVLYGMFLSMQENWTSAVGGVSGVTLGHVYLGISLGILLMLIYRLQNLVEGVRSLRNGSPEKHSLSEPAESKGAE